MGLVRRADGAMMSEHLEQKNQRTANVIYVSQVCQRDAKGKVNTECMKRKKAKAREVYLLLKQEVEQEAEGRRTA